MNLQLIETPQPNIVNAETSRQNEYRSTFKTDPLLSEYQGCFSENLGKLATKVNLGIDPSAPPGVHTLRKVPIVLLEPSRAKLKEMREDGVIEQEEEHRPWVSSGPVTNKGKPKIER